MNDRVPSEELEFWIEHAVRKSAIAARQNKPVMWAYHLAVAKGLRDWFESVEPAASEDRVGQGGFAGAALALMQKADHECPRLPPDRAAHLWALRVYAERVFRAWEMKPDRRASLLWLRQRAHEAAEVANVPGAPDEVDLSDTAAVARFMGRWKDARR